MVSLVAELLQGMRDFGDWLLHPLRWPSSLWRLGLTIWVCRISVLSAAGGAVLIAGTEQARDFFSDLGLSNLQWSAFLGLMFVWAWIVHAAARRTLLSDDWVPEAHCPEALSDSRRAALRAQFYWPALLMPRLLGLSVFGSVFLALEGRSRTAASASATMSLPIAPRTCSKF